MSSNIHPLQPTERPLPILDHEAALVRLGGDEALFRDMVQFFDEDSPPLLEAIRAGIRDGDAEQVGRAAHTLKGLAANFNAEPTVAAARRLEQIGQAPEQLDQAPPALAELEREVALLSAALGPYRPASEGVDR